MRREAKTLLLLLLGVVIFTPFIIGFTVLQAEVRFSLHGGLFLLSFSVPLIFYCFFLYRYSRGKWRTKYPIVPPEGRTDIYFPRTDIPRPIHEDTRRYPRFFRRRRTPKRKAEEMEKTRRKK